MEAGGVALSSLQPRYHALFTVDESQWWGTHNVWPCFVNILEHSGGSPGALYLNNIILYRHQYTVYYHGQKLCVPQEDNESQTTASDSTTSLDLPLSHQSEVQTELWHGGLVARDCLPLYTVCSGAPWWRRSTVAVVPRQRTVGSVALAGDNPGKQSLSPPCRVSIWTSGSQSQSSSPPIPSQSLVEITETSENPTHYSLFTNSITVIQIKKWSTTVCVFTHTHVALARS